MRIMTATASLPVGLLNLVGLSRGILEELLIVALLHEGWLELLNDLCELQGYRGLPWLDGRL